MAKTPKVKCRDPRKSPGYLINLEEGWGEPITDCGVLKGKNFCVGDRVERIGVGAKNRKKQVGTIMGAQKIEKEQGVLVCWDLGEKDRLPFWFAASEVKKL
jgi:hypothetical protein